MFEFIEKILKSEDLFPSIDIDFSNFEKSIFSFGEIFSNDIISDLESLSLFRVESIEEILNKLIESNIEIPEAQIERIIEYLKTDPVILEKISEGISSIELIEIIKEKKDVIFSKSESENVLTNNIQTIEEKENSILQYIKDFIPTEYIENIISTGDLNTLQIIKNNLNTTMQEVLGSSDVYTDINFENISNSYFQDIINNIETSTLQKSFFDIATDEISEIVNIENVTNEISEIVNIENVINEISEIVNIENVTNEISDISNQISQLFINNESQNIQNVENIENVNLSNIEGSIFNESIFEGSTFNEFLSTINFNNLKTEISNLYEEINKTNETLAQTDFTVSENTNIFDETTINSLTTKVLNKENTEILEIKEVVNNLQERVIETHHEIAIMKDEIKIEPNIQKAEPNIQKAEMKIDNIKDVSKKEVDSTPVGVSTYQLQRIPKDLPDFPEIGEIFI